ncbi:MAG TPA: phosphotransferase family protein [Streptosporangiaceae bacterium]|nr:phosphotransferase family protein [Streptosporangiaceae bacterium]
MTTPSAPQGIGSLPRLADWLESNVTHAPTDVTQALLIAGGRSNLTYRLTVATAVEPAQQLVLRRPPLGHVLPTAHDMSREYRVLTGLSGGTKVPVARPVALCTDTEVIGAPFYLMDYVPGRVIRTRDDARDLSPEQAAVLAYELAGMLAAIHAVDVTATGLGDLGRGSGYLRRQLDRWQRQWQLSVTRELPEYDTLVGRLEAGLPAEGETTLVHGDFRIDNVLADVHGDQPKIMAVVDWEMATLGDPLADLGLTLVYWADSADEQWANPADAISMPGFGTRAQFAAEYARQTGRDVSRIGYYMAFGYFKLAVVLEGINARYLKHQTVGENFDREGPAVPILIARAHQTLDSLA